MTPAELQSYLHEHIPLSAAMQVSVIEASAEQVTLEAPLAPNINHRDTVFGGSASALAILAAWSLLHVRLTESGIRTRLVIQRNTMSYERAIAGTFRATAQAPAPEVRALPWRRCCCARRGRRAGSKASSWRWEANRVSGRFCFTV